VEGVFGRELATERNGMPIHLVCDAALSSTKPARYRCRPFSARGPELRPGLRQRPLPSVRIVHPWAVMPRIHRLRCHDPFFLRVLARRLRRRVPVPQPLDSLKFPLQRSRSRGPWRDAMFSRCEWGTKQLGTTHWSQDLDRSGCRASRRVPYEPTSGPSPHPASLVPNLTFRQQLLESARV
jgi:hypothetical protein